MCSTGSGYGTVHRNHGICNRGRRSRAPLIIVVLLVAVVAAVVIVVMNNKKKGEKK